MRNLSKKHLRAQGFKKKWLSDGSGHWWKLKLSNSKSTIPVSLIYDDDTNDLTLQVKTLQECKPFKRDKSWTFILIRPGTIKNLAKMITHGIYIAAKK